MPCRGWPRRVAGQNTVEFAFVSIMLFILIFGVIEMGWFLFNAHEVNAAAREGARYAAVHGSRSAGKTKPNEISAYNIDVASVKAAALAHANLPDPSSFNLTLAKPDGDYAPKHRVVVQVTYQYTPLVSFILPTPRPTLTRTSSMLIHY